MALSAGRLTVTIVSATGIKDCDWFKKQDPYCIVKCAGHKYQTKTHHGGGTKPVWNESFKFNLLDDNTVKLKLLDYDVIGKDDVIGTASFNLSEVRRLGELRLQVPVMIRKTEPQKQQGCVTVFLRWEPFNGEQPQAQAQAQAGAPAQAAPAQQPQAPAAQPQVQVQGQGQRQAQPQAGQRQAQPQRQPQPVAVA